MKDERRQEPCSAARSWLELTQGHAMLLHFFIVSPSELCTVELVCEFSNAVAVDVYSEKQDPHSHQ